jgi:hypothetical protein
MDLNSCCPLLALSLSPLYPREMVTHTENGWELDIEAAHFLFDQTVLEPDCLGLNYISVPFKLCDTGKLLILLTFSLLFCIKEHDYRFV